MKRLLPLITLMFVSAPSAFASMYPPDYASSPTCQNQGPIRVCVQYGFYRQTNLMVRYEGFLNFPYRVYVRVNGRDTIRYLDRDEFGSTVLKLKQPYVKCEANRNTGATGQFDCIEADQETKDLFYYAINDRGMRNALDVEVAFTNVAGEWDSNYGQNYKFHFAY